MSALGTENDRERNKDSFLTEEEISIFSLYCEQFPACMGQSVSKVFGVSCMQISGTEEEADVTEVVSNKKIIHCEICEKNFASSSSLRVHQKKHKVAIGLLCQLCDKRFGSKANLERHLRVHNGIKPFSCPECFQTFTTKGHLTDHYRKHSGEKPFVCYCGKRFRRSSTLKKHSFIHTGEKPHLCGECGKGFIDSGNLKTHQRTHTNERPFRCSFIECKKCFKTKGHLQEHLLTKAHFNKKNQ